MNKILLSAILGLSLIASTMPAQQLTGAKVTLQTAATSVIKPVTVSTSAGTSSAIIDTPWQPVLEQAIHMSQANSLVLKACFETSVLTSTSVSSKNMVSDTTTGSAAVKVRVVIDPNTPQQVIAAPGEVVFQRRTQTLTATLEGAIAKCLSVVTNSGGGLSILLDTNCVTAETVGLTLDTSQANSFEFAWVVPGSGDHVVQVQAKLIAYGSNQAGTFTAMAVLGKGSLVVESVRLAKTSPQPYGF